MLVDMKKIDIFKTGKGSRIRYRKRCELCKYSAVDELTDKLICVKTLDWTDENELCEKFIIHEEIQKDIIDGCMEAR